MNQTKTRLQCLNGSTLKMIAMVTMLIDHMAAVVILYMTTVYRASEMFSGANTIYIVMRQIGRTAFPIFCFLLIEGFVHTRDRFRYLARLMMFALVSEVPFDLALTGKAISWQNQNVYFTLALGMGMMMVMEWGASGIRNYFTKNENVNAAGKSYVFEQIFKIVILFLFMVLAKQIHCDYAENGVLLIAILFLLKEKRLIACIVGYLAFMWEPFCFPAFLLIPLYNGRRGWNVKYIFYAFYPLHLLLLYVLRVMLLS